MIRAADVQQSVTVLKGIDFGRVHPHQLAAADDAEHDIGQVPRRAADFLGGDLAFGEGEPGIGGEQVLWPVNGPSATHV